MFMPADAAKAEIESIGQSIESISKNVNKLSEVGSELLDQAIAFGIKVLIAIVILVVGRFVIKQILKIVDKIFERSSIDIGVSKFVHSVLNILLYILLIIIICGKVGIETTSFVALLASAGLAIGLAFEGSLSNFAGGLLILITKPFIAGDYIASNGVEGVVEKIDIFYTTLCTVDNKVVKFPNGTLSNSILTNYSMEDKRRVDVRVRIHYNDDIKAAKNVLEKVMRGYENVLKEEDNIVVVKALEDSCISLEVRMWVNTDNYVDAQFYMNENIITAFNKEGIKVPYNQLDVNLHQIDREN